MPRKEKHPIEMTTEETMKKLFPKEVRDKARKLPKSPANPTKNRLISEVYRRLTDSSSI